MANDWIKVRCDLHTHPKVVRIMSAVCPQTCTVVGGLHYIWSLFDAHSTDGILEGYSLAMIDRMLGLPGFAQAVVDVGWLIVTPKGLQMPRFDEHNGQGAKRRAEDTSRKRVRRMSANDADTTRTECGPEKRREEKNTKTPPIPQRGTGDADKPAPKKRLLPPYTEAFNRFWSAYPSVKRINKPGTFKVWKSQDIERTDKPVVELVMRGLESWKRCHQWNKDGGQFVCLPVTFMNQLRWANEPPTAPKEVSQ
jgi:hypothetical protein